MLGVESEINRDLPAFWRKKDPAALRFPAGHDLL